MSSHDSDDHVQSDPAQEPNEDKTLEDWLQEQVKKLQALRAQEQRLNAKGMRLKFDFLANGRGQGRILKAVRERLKEMPGKFKKWVVENTDIGYSTALMWIDLDENYDEVKEGIAHSNTLESTVRQLRDAIRDKRQAEGKGKPGSGRRRKATTPKEQKGSLAWGLRERWELNKAEPGFTPPQQSEEDFKAARLCFQHAMNADSTYATVAQATGKDEEEVKRLLLGLDVDKLDAEGAECRRRPGDDLTAARTQAVERRKAKNGSTEAHAQQTDPKTDDAQPGAETFFHHGCKDFEIEDDRTLSLTDQHGNRVYIVSEKKGIGKLLVKAVTSYTSKGGEK
jgi:hypothetical protein